MRPASLPRPIIRRSCLRRIRDFATASHASSQPSFDNRISIVEVGPRDGLQNEKTAIPLATKISLIERLSKTGVSRIEAGSFVSPKWVPQVRGQLYGIVRCRAEELTWRRWTTRAKS